MRLISPIFSLSDSPYMHVPDDEGIETRAGPTGARRAGNMAYMHVPDDEGIETSSSMATRISRPFSYMHVPDDEGIETPESTLPGPLPGRVAYMHVPDDEGIETDASIAPIVGTAGPILHACPR